MLNYSTFYTVLCVFFSVLTVLGNLVYQKFVILPFFKLEFSVGAVLYPLVFFVTDLTTEIYGRERAKFSIKLGIIMNIIVALLVAIMDHLEATRWSQIDNALFHRVFGFYSIAFIASVTACYIAQNLDVTLYSLIRKLTGGKWLWVRSTISTILSLFFDTIIVISIMTMFHIIDFDLMLSLTLGSYIFKAFFAIFFVPVFYVLLKVVRKILTADSCFVQPIPE